MKILKVLVLVFLIGIVTGNSLMAQEPIATDWGLHYTMTPENPGPGDYVFIKVDSYSIDVNRSNISYYVNDKLQDGGTGQTNFVYKLPKSNKLINIVIVAKTFDDKVYQKQIKIKPVSVDLVYEVVDGYKIPFYKGKSRAISNSKIKFFAFPDFVSSKGKKLDPKTLIYNWSVNNKFQKDKSGIGRDTFFVNETFGFPRKTIVTVKVSNLDGSLRAVQGIVVRSEMPHVDFYLDNRVLPFNFKNIVKDNLIISNNFDIDVVAVPYFFNDLNRAKTNWIINNNKLDLYNGGDDFRLNIIRKPENIGTPLNIRLSIDNKYRVLQSSTDFLLIHADDETVKKYRNEIKNKDGFGGGIKQQQEDDQWSVFGL